MSMEQLNEIDELKDALIGRDIDVGRLTKQRDDCGQQLAAALAAIKSKDAALQSAISAHRYESGDLHDALAIQPNDNALTDFLGEPVAWIDEFGFLFHTVNEPDEYTPLYSPKWRTK